MACVSESQQSQGTNGRSQITEEKLTKFLKNLPVEKSPSELKELQKTCDIKRPSKQWKDIVAVEVSQRYVVLFDLLVHSH